MNKPKRHGRADNAGSVCFAQVLRAELRTVLPDLALPQAAQPADEAAEHALEEATFKAIDGSDSDLAALCLSGGGIRSATFALGIMQGLARYGLLGQFHYLSTVSGGGYIGSWLAAWRSTATDADVFDGLNIAQRTGNEAPQIKAIRADSNYLTPGLGLLSADTWTVIALYVRNLLLNWLLFVPFFMGVLLFPRLCRSVLMLTHSSSTAAPYTLIGAAFVTIGLSFAVYARFRQSGQWLTQGRFIAIVLTPMVLSAMYFTQAAVIANVPGDLSSSEALRDATLLGGAVIGALIYAFSWAAGRLAAGRLAARVQKRDLLYWSMAGALVGLLIAAGMQWIVGNRAQIKEVTVLGLSGCVLAYQAGELLYLGLASFAPAGDMDREWLARSSGWMAATAVTWAVISSISLYAPNIAAQLCAYGWGGFAGLGVGGLSGFVTLIMGSGAMTAATRAAEVFKQVSLLRIAATAAVIFALFLAAALALADQQLLEALGNAIKPSVSIRAGLLRVGVEAGLLAALLAGAFLISLFVNVNHFSMHALYRNRLIRAFLGSARAPQRRPDPFTGFDPGDNRKLKDVVPHSGTDKLFHVINAALNVVASNNPAWQERKAESFVFTRLFCGNPFVRYQPTAAYGNRTDGVSLGTAMAISGAAVSPNQGYNSAPLIAFLLMLFNVRLGWWLGNPRRKFFRREGPVWGITPALKELAGATTDDGNWIYLSDGGHFENLGLYEMIRRRCRFIVVSDAGCDPQCSFEDLGNAVRKIYIDFGVSIDFDKLEIRARQNPPVPGLRFALGSITYPGAAKQGWLLYLKPTYQGTMERADVRSYASSHLAFPHESTTDQWFSESQLESYRALGASIAEYVCRGGSGERPAPEPQPMTLQSLRAAAEGCLQRIASGSGDGTAAGPSAAPEPPR